MRVDVADPERVSGLVEHDVAAGDLIVRDGRFARKHIRQDNTV